MFTAKRVLTGCLLLPVLLVTSCTGKMYFDRAMYVLPGEVLRSTATPTQNLASAVQVAEALDTYVQPRFEILRDKNFGALRIVYRKHAGIVQLKVDTPEEQRLIANVNAANRDYAISLLHCAPKPGYRASSVTPRLQLLYFNQHAVASEMLFYPRSISSDVAKQNQLDWDAIEQKAITALPQLIKGKEQHATHESWDLLMRPVLASKPACLSCHEEAKPGSVLGVMVYAVRNSRKDAAARISLGY